ncbi:Chitin binding domain-containing protein [Aphelenchoides fujianensis]|nr:Chitin binding domain-containing protein [Aphelenchoides fujianensis]
MKTRTGLLFVWSLVACSFAGAQPRGTRPEIACQGHADGLYVINPQACNDGFYKCANGRSYYYQCPQGLFFSTEDAQCEYKQTIPACGGHRPAQPIVQQPAAPLAAVHQVAPAIPAQPSQATKLTCPASLVFDPQVKGCEYADACGKPRPPPTTTQTPPPTPPPSTACVGKTDGFYVKARCDTNYLHCTNGVAYELTCPAQLAFDGQQCIYREDCLNPTTPPAPVAPVQTTPAVPRSQWCQQNNKPDGTHGHGCSSKFYACGGGFTTEINCPGGLVYDQTTQSCDQRQFVPACGGVRPPPTTTIAAPIAPRPAGQAGELACPAGTRYSSQLHTCDWPQNVPECGGQLPTSTVPAPVAPVAPQVPQSSYGYAAASDDSGRPDRPGRAPRKLNDGIYGRRCSRHYFVCSVNKTYEFTCPQGYAYDRQLARCGPKSGIPTCSSAQPVAAAPQAAVAPYSSG